MVCELYFTYHSNIQSCYCENVKPSDDIQAQCRLLMSFLPGPCVDRVRGKAPRSPTPRFSTAPPPHPAFRSHDHLELMPGSLPAGWPETQPTSSAVHTHSRGGCVSAPGTTCSCR
ncbi:unnamed protein product [Rangifer tarandus platyrhynchus]|uniref:Uncharacterized protein n=2 Tax=Rangifer tarandus platyrhynchus TaxID=3082113 RepID=A0ABN8Y140_RANTA|nr:unnamed protein product [Rangifer tarandus platyrhynchus]